MKFLKTEIPDVILIEPKVFGDERGFFMETWEARKFRNGGVDVDFVQDNHSRSRQEILRGLHYQIENPQGKLVRVGFGEVYDVVVDLRRGSHTFGRWLGFTLSDTNHRMLWVPPGFAHGFYVVSEFADFSYKCSEFYTPECERCIRWDDPDLAIDWPLVDNKRPILSEKDASGVPFRSAEVYP